MTWTTPRDWATGELVTASMMNTHVRDNLDYLMARPQGSILRDNNATYTTTSSSFTPIDSTNLAITVTPKGTKVLLLFGGVVSSTVSADVMWFDIQKDGAGLAGGDGLVRSPGSPGFWPVGMAVVATGLTPGTSYVFRPVWKTANNGTLLAGAPVAGQNIPVSFIALEIG